MKRHSLVVVHAAAALALAVSSGAAAAERAWTEVKSPHFTVLSNDGDRSARNVAWQLEQVRGVMQRLWGWARVDTAKPLLILAVADEASMKALAPEYWEQKNGVRPGSVFVEGPDRYAIALRSDLKVEDRDGVNPYRSAYWSYVGVVMSSSLDRDLPLWFQRGLADVFSNTIVRDNAIQLGRVIPWHLQRLQRGTPPPIRELIAVDRKSPWYTQADRLEQFDAACWAFMHYLMFADEGSHRAQLDRFMALLIAGKPPAAAVEEAFVNLDLLQKGFSSYSSRRVYEYNQVEVDVRTKREAFPARNVPAPEAASLRASFLAAMDRPVEARALIEEARKGDPRLAAPYETEGMLFEADEKDDNARAAYAKAVELGSTNYYAHYRLASLTWRQDREPDADTLAAIKTSLDRSIALNDRFAGSYSMLGEVQVRLKQTDEALAAARRAVALEGRSVYYRLSLARVLWNASRQDEAETAARNALALSRTDAERRAAQELLDFIVKNRKT